PEFPRLSGRQNRSCRAPFCYFCGEAKVSPAGRRRIKIKAFGSAAAERSKMSEAHLSRLRERVKVPEKRIS
ncbi:hypothetical protein, partial [Flavobacterium sp.]|uniref:hypothetical protein n=1 Tax=Flavobacterium sp. TaxID=239 RepID=UPI0025C1095E